MKVGGTLNLSPTFGTLALVAMAAGTLLSLFPLWRSATLSPDSIKRRTFWAGVLATVVFAFLTAWPDWQEGLFVSIALGLAMAAVALRYTSFVKIRGKVYGVPPYRHPDRPPSLAPDHDDD